MNETFEILMKNYRYECLFRIFGRKAMEEFDFVNAEKAFLECDDYSAL